MTSWNKEKAVFFASLVVLALVVIQSIASWTGAPGGATFDFREPEASTRVETRTVEKIAWVELASVGPEARDPFQAISEWRPAPPDPMPLPGIPPLEYRVPLPSEIATAAGARPARAKNLPEVEGEADDDDDEEGSQ